MANQKKTVIERTGASLNNPMHRKKWHSIAGIMIMILFVAASAFINTTVQALNQSSGEYGYYNGTYGYNSSTASSDAVPSAPTNFSVALAGLTSVNITWDAPSTTTLATSLDNLEDYTIATSESSISDCTGGTNTGDTVVGATVSSLTADTDYYIAICANDTNGNQSAALTSTFSTAGALTSTNVQPASTTISQTQTNTISFTLVNSLPANGKIVVTYPAGFDVSDAASGTCSTMDGSFTTSVSGQIVTITRSGGSSEPAGAQTCTIGTIVNPSSAGSAGTYSIKTTDSSDLTLDIDASVSADTFSAASSSGGGGGGGGGGGSSTTTDTTDDSTEDTTDTTEDTTETTESDSTTASYTVGTATSVSVGGSSHTVTVSAATETEVTLTIESEPVEVTIATGESEDVDTDGDGIADVRIAYGGLDSDGNPELTITAITVSTTCSMPSGTGTSPVTGEDEDITDVEAGNYIKSDGYATVYYVTTECGRRVFMDEKTYFTWQSSYDNLVTVTDATLSELSLEGVMLPKAGVVLVKIQSDPKVYALGAGSTYSPSLQWITSEDVAIELFGDDWADYVIDIEPTFFSKFATGSDIEDASDFEAHLSNMKKRDKLHG